VLETHCKRDTSVCPMHHPRLKYKVGRVVPRFAPRTQSRNGMYVISIYYGDTSNLFGRASRIKLFLRFEAGDTPIGGAMLGRISPLPRLGDDVGLDKARRRK
jgi:hypothetical protein